MSDARNSFIAQVVAGKTFADVGGLWGTVNEKVSVASKHRAAALAMIDITEEGGALWQAFEARMMDLGVRDYRCHATDICAVSDLQFDVVHCSGVLYHHPNPHVLLDALRRATREHLILSSAVTQEVVENKHGTYRIPPSGVIFVPALTDEERKILGAYWTAVGAEAHGITHPAHYKPSDFGPWWWLPTAHALQAMARVAGFEVIGEAPIWRRNAHTLLLRKI
jgi:Methyltransferase domain